MYQVNHVTKYLGGLDRPVLQVSIDQVSTMSAKSDFNYMVVGAIDFGTSYSGYAYSFRHSRTDIQRNRWNAGSRGLISEKTPTCILFDGDQNFSAFGFDAEDEFAEICYETKQKKDSRCFFFRGYKMALYEKMVVSMNIKVEDIHGKEMSLLKVVTETIKYLKQELINDVAKRVDKLEGTDVLYVLTVPAIWSDSAKAFMRKAAEEAGIPSKQLRMCLEPEAAAIYCQTVPCQSQKGLSSSQLNLLKPGSRYILIDAGGGTADIIAQEIQENGGLKEILPASGGSWGGTTVDDEFLAFLKKIHGHAFEEFKMNEAYDYFDLLREFEVKKRTRQVQTDASKPIVLRVPVKVTKMPQANNITGNEVEMLDSLTLDNDKLRLEHDLFRHFFKTSREEIVSHVKELLAKQELSNVSTLILVGGYAESKLLQDFVRDSFRSKTVIVPNQPGLAVLKGSVIFGHDPSVIAERVCRFTYGIKTNSHFDGQRHTLASQFTDEDGFLRARDCFKIHCKIGQNVKTNVFQESHSYLPKTIVQKSICFPLYACPRENPTYVYESDCSQIGFITISCKGMNGPKSEREILVSLGFGGTEITMKATVKQTGEVLTSTITYDW